jgi:hypothetical protein
MNFRSLKYSLVALMLANLTCAWAENNVASFEQTAIDDWLHSHGENAQSAPRSCSSSSDCTDCIEVCYQGQCQPSGLMQCAESPNGEPGACSPPAQCLGCQGRCTPCLQRCRDGVCVDSRGTILCADGSCSNRSEPTCPENCNGGKGCKACTETCKNKVCTQNTNRLCEDGTCLEGFYGQCEYQRRCAPPCAPCTQKCVLYNSTYSCVDTERILCDNGLCVRPEDIGRCRPTPTPTMQLKWE